jgi:hypothetical protein
MSRSQDQHIPDPCGGRNGCKRLLIRYIGCMDGGAAFQGGLGLSERGLIAPDQDNLVGSCFGKRLGSCATDSTALDRVGVIVSKRAN